VIEKVEVYRIEAPEGRGVMYLASLDRSIESLTSALHHIELMPDSLTVDLNGADGTRIRVTKPEAAQLLDDMRLLKMQEAVDHE
jgi:hypothetical protein